MDYKQKQPSIGVLRKRYSENMHQIYCRACHAMLCNFFEVSLRHGCSPVNLLHIFRTPFYMSTYGGSLLYKRQLILESACQSCLKNSFSQNFGKFLRKTSILKSFVVIYSLTTAVFVRFIQNI